MLKNGCNRCHSEPFTACHSEPFTACYSEPSPRVILSGALHRPVRGGAKNLLFRGSRFGFAQRP